MRTDEIGWNGRVEKKRKSTVEKSVKCDVGVGMGEGKRWRMVESCRLRTDECLVV